MPSSSSKKVYHRLVIVATDPQTEIWLGDDRGHLVQKETGGLDTRLLPGEYTVEFGLGTAQYAVPLERDIRLTEADIIKQPQCERRIPVLDDDEAE